MNQISTITLPRVTKGWLAKARAEIEKERELVLDIQRDEHTEEFRAKYDVSRGIGFWSGNMELFVEQPQNPFAGIVYFFEMGKKQQVTYEWLPQEEGPTIVRFRRFEPSVLAEYPEGPEVVDQYTTTFQTRWIGEGDPFFATSVEAYLRREWEVSTAGESLPYHHWLSFLHVLRRNARYRELKELEAPKIILDHVQESIETPLAKLCEFYPLEEAVGEGRLSFPLTDEALRRMLALAGYDERMLYAVWQQKDRERNVWGDMLTLDRLHWTYSAMISEGVRTKKLRFSLPDLPDEERSQRRRDFLISELGLSDDELNELMTDEPTAALWTRLETLSENTATKLFRYTKRRMRMAKELKEFLVWLEGFSR